MRGQSDVVFEPLSLFILMVLNFYYHCFCLQPLGSKIWHGIVDLIIPVTGKDILLLLLNYGATQTEVTQLYVAVLLDEDVRWLEVSMN